MTLDAVNTFRVPAQVVAETEDALRRAGGDGWELFVLWTGQQTGPEFDVHRMVVPEQKAYKTPDGLLVRVEGPALHKMNVELFERSEVLGVQVHAHPTHAFHSDTDSAYPIVTALGGLSIVAADFCRTGLLARRTAAYRLTSNGWKRVRKLDKLVAVV
jgi:hypothetical protein